MSQKNKVESYTDIHVIYKPKIYKKYKTRIFGKNFVNNNKDKAKIIFNGNEYELTEYFEDFIHDDDKYEIRLTLRILEDIIDLSEMFAFCDSLYSFPPDEEKIEENINNCQLENVKESEVKLKYKKNFNTNTDYNIKRNSLELLNTSKVTNIWNIFGGCYSLISLPDISK